mgnify:CR=1 FL=1
MEFELSAEQREIQELARAFARERIEPHAAAWDRERGFPPALVDELGQVGMLFTLPLFLQTAEGRSAQVTGFWLLPMGLSVIFGAQLGGRLVRRVTATTVARAGLVVQAASYVAIIRVIEPGIEFVQILPGLIGFGIGIGFASSQLTNVVLSEVPLDKAGGIDPSTIRFDVPLPDFATPPPVDFK